MGQSTFIIHKGVSFNQRIDCRISTSLNNFETRLCQMYYVSMALILPHGVSDSFGNQVLLFLRSAPYVAGYCVRLSWRPTAKRYVISGQGVDHETRD
jgi:hypothetical protein